MFVRHVCPPESHGFVVRLSKERRYFCRISLDQNPPLMTLNLYDILNTHEKAGNLSQPYKGGPSVPF